MDLKKVFWKLVFIHKQENFDLYLFFSNLYQLKLTSNVIKFIG